MKYTVSHSILFCSFLLSAASIFTSSAQEKKVLSNNEVTYEVSQDQGYLNVTMKTSDVKTIRSILHLGVSVFFDVKGKEKENVFVKYPLEPLRLNSRPNRNDSSEDRDPEKEEAEIKERFARILENDFPQEAAYTFFDREEKFHVLLNSLDITAAYTYNTKSGELMYNLTIPKSKINFKSDKDFEKLMIGVKTNQREKMERNSDRPQVSMGGRGSGGRGGGQGGGGQRGGGQRGGGQGGQNDGPPKSNKREKPTDVLIDFWFEANLKP